MNERNKAFLAAMLAVQRGLLDADAAVELLAELEERPAPGAEPAAAEPAPPLSVACASIASPGLEAEVEALANDPARAQRTLIDFGCDASLAQSLVEFGASIAADDMRQTLHAVAAGAPRRTFASTTLTSLTDHQRYDLKREQGRGGMGVVFLAFDKTLDREVALKRLLPAKTPGGRHSPLTPATNPAETVERFLREAKVTGQLDHPNIIPVYEIAQRDDGEVYYTMKFVRGRSMADRLAAIKHDTSFTESERLQERLKLIDAFIDVCHALAYAHNKGVIHRDLKPDNIMLGGFGETLLVDWGLAHVRGEQDSVPRANLSIAGNSVDADSAARLTIDGAVIGTPAYMSPEQAKGELAEVDERSDVYSLGAVLYEIIGGQAPFAGNTVQKLLAQAAQGQRRDLRGLAPGAPRELVAIANFAMQLDPARRPQSANLLAQEVIAWRDGGRVSAYEYSSWELLQRFARRNRAVLAGTCVVVLALLGFYAVDSWQEEQVFEKALTERKQEIAAYHARYQSLQPEELLKQANHEITTILAANASRAEAPGVAPDLRQLLDSLLDAANAAEEMVEHGMEPVAERSVEGLLPIAADQLKASELRLRDLAARLAAVTGGWDLAERIIRDTPVDDAKQQVLRDFVDEQRGRRLAQRGQRIAFVLDDVRRGLSRDGRTAGAPLLDDYVFELVTYRDAQTVEFLEQALMPLTEKARDHWQAAQQQGQFKQLDWTQEEGDVIRLCCRVLGRLEQGEEAVKALKPLSEWIRDHALVQEVVWALCRTRTRAARHAVENLEERIGLEHGTSIAFRPALQLLPEVDPDEYEGAKGYLRRAYERMLANDAAGAQSDALRAIATDAESGLAYAYKAVIEAWLKDTNDEDVRAGLLRDFNEALRLDPRNPRIFYLRASHHLYVGGDVFAALKDSKQALDLDPFYARAMLIRAIATHRVHAQDRAREILDEALRLDNHSAELFAASAEFLMGSNDWTRAISECARALELDPTNRKALSLLLTCYYEMHEYRNVESRASDFIRAYPGQIEGYLWRGKARKQLRDLEGALSDLDKAVERDPRNEDAFVSRGDVLEALGRYADAEASYRAALEQVKSPYYALLALARVRLRAQDFEEAELICTKIITDIAADQDVPYLVRAEALFRQRRFDEALADCAKAWDLKPGEPESYRMGGEILERQRDFTRAAACYSNGIKAMPDDPAFYVRRGMVRMELKEHAAAGDDFSNAIKWGLEKESSNSIHLMNHEIGRWYLFRSVARGLSGDLEGQAADLERASNRNADTTWLQFAELLRTIGRGELKQTPARTVLEQFFAANKFELGRVLYWVLPIDEQLGLYEDLRERLKGQELSEPDHKAFEFVELLLGIELNKAQRYAESYDLFKRAVDRAPIAGANALAAYNAACSASAQAMILQQASAQESEVVEWRERAMAMLVIAAEAGWTDSYEALNRPAFEHLHDDPRWLPTIERFKANAEKAASGR